MKETQEMIMLYTSRIVELVRKYDKKEITGKEYAQRLAQEIEILSSSIAKY